MLSLSADLALVAFNAPVVAALIAVPFLANLKQALREKSPTGDPTDATSYSRISGFVGSIVLLSLYWSLGNVVLVDALTSHVPLIQPLVNAVLPFFMLGSALFLPYAFNQLKSMVGGFAPGASARAAGAPQAAPAPVSPAVGTTAPTQITIANLTDTIDDPTFAAAVAAINMQVSRDFLKAWGGSAVLTAQRLALQNGAAPVGAVAGAVVYVGNSTADPVGGPASAYAYHTLQGGSTPYGFVYLDVCNSLQRSWITALSHEVLEMLADPDLIWSATGPAPAASPDAGRQVRYEYEICDPTEGDSYPINGLPMSNFVTKAYFIAGSSPTSTTFLGAQTPLAPFDVRPGGYVQYEVDDVAQTYPPAGPSAAAARALMGPWRRNARRADAAALRAARTGAKARTKG